MELYFHIPFCVRKCLYCDFLSAPAGRETQDAYMEALLRETAGRAADYASYRVETAFIGGGTPSLVDARWVERLLQTVKECYSVAKDAEITMEVNPGTVDEEKLTRYFGAGVNRLSIGLQSADNGELKRLGRIHTWENFLETYRLARKAGFQNVNVDVMSALPGQERKSYEATLEKVLNLCPMPEHISAYSLIVEEGTPFFGMRERGELALPDEEEERLMYERTGELLGGAGFQRYEISNYARAGYACRHNSGYWRRTDYAGFGIGAASLINNTRFQNGDSLESYVMAPTACRGEKQVLTVKEQMEEFMFLGLRMTEGISEQEFKRLFCREPEEVYGSVIGRNIADGLLKYEACKAAGDRMLALTKRGVDLSNYVMAQFLFDEEE